MVPTKFSPLCCCHWQLRQLRGLQKQKFQPMFVIHLQMFLLKKQKCQTMLIVHVSFASVAAQSEVSSCHNAAIFNCKLHHPLQLLSRLSLGNPTYEMDFAVSSRFIVPEQATKVQSELGFQISLVLIIFDIFSVRSAVQKGSISK